MATSGTYAFTMTRDSLIGAALRLVQAFGDQDIIPSSDINNCAQALNVIVKEMVTEGLPLWCVQEVVIPLVAGQATYDLSAAAGMPLPPRILDCFVRDSASNDTQMVPVARIDYNRLGQKSSQGTPNQFFYDQQLSAGVVTVYNVPADSLSSLHITIQRQLQDFNLATDNPDFPQEASRLLKWCLADEIALEYHTPDSVRLEINQKATALKDKYFAFSQEAVSTFFSPAGRWGK